MPARADIHRLLRPDLFVSQITQSCRGLSLVLAGRSPFFYSRFRAAFWSVYSTPHMVRRLVSCGSISNVAKIHLGVQEYSTISIGNVPPIIHALKVLGRITGRIEDARAIEYVVATVKRRMRSRIKA
jgi:hypothetical protein